MIHSQITQKLCWLSGWWWWGDQWWSWPSYNSAHGFLHKLASGLCPCRYAIWTPEDLTSELNTCKLLQGWIRIVRCQAYNSTIKSVKSLDQAAWTLKVHKLRMGSSYLCASKEQISERRGRGCGCPAFLAWAESLSSRLSPSGSKVGEQSHGMSLRGFECMLVIEHHSRFASLFRQSPHACQCVNSARRQQMATAAWAVTHSLHQDQTAE